MILWSFLRTFQNCLCFFPNINKLFESNGFFINNFLNKNVNNVFVTWQMIYLFIECTFHYLHINTAKIVIYHLFVEF